MATVNALLVLLAWGIVCILLVVLYRIARFYQITSGRPSRYRWFALPLVLLVAAAVIEAVVGGPSLVGDLLLLGGGLSLLAFGYKLLSLMTGSRS